MLAARLDSAEAVAGFGDEFAAIASAVIGGTSLFGGVGAIFGTAIPDSVIDLERSLLTTPLIPDRWQTIPRSGP